MPMFPEGIGLPPGVREGDLPWGEHQAWGILMSEWMAGKDGWKYCPIHPSPLTWEELEQWDPVHEVTELNDYIIAEVDKLGLEAPFADQNYHNLTIDGKTNFLVDWELPPETNYDWTTYFDAYIGEGIMMIHGMFRREGPHLSSIAIVSYQHYFPLNTLRHIFVLDIVNKDTKTFLNREIRPLHTPEVDEDTAAITSEYGTDDFEGLLGTDIGKRIATIVLEGFDRGTKTVGRIVTWRRTGGDGLARAILQPDGQMRFELDDFPPSEVEFEWDDDDKQAMEKEPTMQQDLAGEKAAPGEGTADNQPGDDQGTAPEPEVPPSEMDLASDHGEQPKEAGPATCERDSSGLSNLPSHLETPSDIDFTPDHGEQPKEAGPGNCQADSSGLSDPPSRLETPSDMDLTPDRGERDSSGLSDPPSRLETPSDMKSSTERGTPPEEDEEEDNGSLLGSGSKKKRKDADPAYRGRGKRRKDNDDNPPPPRRSARIATQRVVMAAG